jgi:hypothetical protein
MNCPICFVELGLFGCFTHIIRHYREYKEFKRFFE